jgi:hypothetical protein
MPGTRAISGAELKNGLRAYQRDHGDHKGRQLYKQHLKEALDAKELRPSDFSVRELFEAFVEGGASIVGSWQSNKAGYGTELLEAGPGGAAVGYSDFSSITGQIFFTETLEKFDAPEFIFTKMIESKASTIADMERFPGITRIGSTTRGVREGQPYPRYGVGEDYIDSPAKVKDGGIVEVTKEAVAGDKTGVLLERCGELGYWLGYGVEERVIDAVIDENDGAAGAYQGGHRYTWRGTAYATYQSSTPWINSKTSNPLTDETSIDALWQLLVAITDPFTGKPIVHQIDTLIVTPNLQWRASRILRSTEIRQTAPGYATTGSPAQTVSPPALGAVIPGLKLASSPILKARLATDTDWFLGNVRKAVKRYYNWDITTAQRSSGTDAEFERDVVLQYKGSLKDAVTTAQPRYMGKSAA